MATELRSSEILYLHGQVVFDGLDGPARPKLLEEVRDAQKQVDEAAARIHDDSQEAKDRRALFVRKNLDLARSYFDETHPYYLARLKEAREGGYLPEPPITHEPDLVQQGAMRIYRKSLVGAR